MLGSLGKSSDPWMQGCGSTIPDSLFENLKPALSVTAHSSGFCYVAEDGQSFTARPRAEEHLIYDLPNSLWNPSIPIRAGYWCALGL